MSAPLPSTDLSLDPPADHVPFLLTDGMEEEELRESYADAPVMADGRYRLGKALGVGAMGRVIRALDTTTGQEVAVKILHEDLRADPLFVECFQGEAALLARCRHPHVVELLDHGEDSVSGDLYLVMELMSRSVHAWLGRPLPWNRVLEWMRAACQAVGHAHQLGVIHRDIKPSNLLLTADARLKVGDFGVATQPLVPNLPHSDLPSTHAVAKARHLHASGTAPEVKAGRPATQASDIHSLGTVLYGLFAGRTPGYLSPSLAASVGAPALWFGFRT
jgi:eukaryotic-like serine/threonine-protein kinase